MEKVEWADVQGLVLSGYPDLPHAAYVLWRFTPDRTAAKKWLTDLSGRLMRAGVIDKQDAASEASAAGDHGAHPTSLNALKTPGAIQLAINLALTARGLKHLEVDDHELAHFSGEFLDGMAPEPKSGCAVPRRCSMLGDLGDNAPDQWEWGGWKGNREIDGALLLYAADEKSLNALIACEISGMGSAAEPLTAAAQHGGGSLIFKAQAFCDRKEHFGFRDGVSQPIIDDTNLAKKTKKKNPKEARVSIVKPGEFVLGYENERDARVLFSNSRNLGRNGTYLVFRQLEQNVRAFRGFLTKAAQRVHGVANAKTEEWVAARLVGRCFNGDPLVTPSADSPVGPDPRNDFLYHFEDRLGLACPVGAHIRRANPRDTIGPDPDTALRLSKMHRIIRRGRPYGPRLPDDALPEAKDDKDQRRGMHFICLNADIAGQYEMIQHSWLNNVHFGGLYTGADPLGHFRAGDDVITVQRRPTNLHVEGLTPFVKVRGGAYFFMPGIRALRTLAQ